MHDLTKTIIDENTLVKTSVDSYLFTCPVCNEVQRYSYNFNDNVEVFCNGEDFGTKVLINDVILEVREFDYFKNDYNSKFKETPTDIIENLTSKGLITVEEQSKETFDEEGNSIITTENLGLLTAKGLTIIEELK